jgi:hypothetical protein
MAAPPDDVEINLQSRYEHRAANSGSRLRRLVHLVDGANRQPAGTVGQANAGGGYRDTDAVRAELRAGMLVVLGSLRIGTRGHFQGAKRPSDLLAHRMDGTAGTDTVQVHSQLVRISRDGCRFSGVRVRERVTHFGFAVLCNPFRVGSCWVAINPGSPAARTTLGWGVERFRRSDLLPHHPHIHARAVPRQPLFRRQQPNIVCREFQGRAVVADDR